LLKDVRNAVGGHFSDEAALYALKEVSPDTPQSIEIVAHPSGIGAGIKLFPALELVGGALLKEKGQKDRMVFLHELFEFSLQAFGHAARAMHGSERLAEVALGLHLLRRAGDLSARSMRAQASARDRAEADVIERGMARDAESIIDGFLAE
jgi:hypothetical protein